MLKDRINFPPTSDVFPNGYYVVRRVLSQQSASQSNCDRTATESRLSHSWAVTCEGGVIVL